MLAEEIILDEVRLRGRATINPTLLQYWLLGEVPPGSSCKSSERLFIKWSDSLQKSQKSGLLSLLSDGVLQTDIKYQA